MDMSTPTQSPPPEISAGVLQAQIVIAPEQAMTLRRQLGAVDLANAWTVVDKDTAEACNAEAQGFKKRREQLEVALDSLTKPAKDIIAAARNIFAEPIACLKEAEGVCKTKVGAWVQAEQARIAAEQRARADAERQARMEAERKAAEDRARAEAEARAKREEADRLEREAKERSDADAAARAAALRVEAQERVEASGQAQMEAVIAATAAVAPAPSMNEAKVSGFGLRKNWKCEPRVSEGDALVQIIAAIACVPAETISGSARKELLGLIALDTKAATKMAKALEENFNVPGLRAFNAPIAATGGR